MAARFPEAGQSCQSCARMLPQELASWICSQNLLLPSEIASRSDCQMAGRDLNLDSNLNSASCPLVMVVRFCVLKISVLSLIFFEVSWKCQIWGQLSVDSNPHPPECLKIRIFHPHCKASSFPFLEFCFLIPAFFLSSSSTCKTREILKKVICQSLWQEHLLLSC